MQLQQAAEPGAPAQARAGGLLSLAQGWAAFLEGIGPKVDQLVDQASDVLESSSEMLAGGGGDGNAGKVAVSPDKSADSRLWIRRLLERNAFLEQELDRFAGAQLRPIVENSTVLMDEVSAVAETFDETIERNNELQAELAHVENQLQESTNRFADLEARYNARSRDLELAMASSQALANQVQGLKRDAASAEQREEQTRFVYEARITDLESALQNFHSAQEDAILLKPASQVSLESKMQNIIDESLTLKRQVDQLLLEKLSLVEQLERATNKASSAAEPALVLQMKLSLADSHVARLTAQVQEWREKWRAGEAAKEEQNALLEQAKRDCLAARNLAEEANRDCIAARNVAAKALAHVDAPGQEMSAKQPSALLVAHRLAATEGETVHLQVLLAEAQAAVEASRLDISKLQVQVRHEIEQRESLGADLGALQVAMTQAEEEHRVGREYLQSVIDENLEQWRRECASLRAETDQAQAEKASLQQKLMETSDALARAMSHTQELGTKLAELERLQSFEASKSLDASESDSHPGEDVVKLEALLSKVQDELVRVQGEATAARSGFESALEQSQAAEAALKSELETVSDRFKQSLSTLQTENAQILVDCVCLREDLARAKQQYGAAEQSSAEARVLVTVLQEKLAAAELRVSREIEALTGAYQARDYSASESGLLRSQLDEAVADARRAYADLQASRLACLAAEVARDEARAAATSAERARELAESEVQSLCAKLHGFQAQVAALQAETKQLSEEKSTLQSDLLALQQVQRQSEQWLELSKHEAEVVRLEYGRALSEKELLATKLIQIEATLGEAKDQASKLHEQAGINNTAAESSKAQVEKLQAHCERLEDNLAASRSENAATQAELQRERTRFSTLMDELAQAHKEAQQVGALRAHAENVEARSSTELRALSASLEQCAMERDAAQSRVVQLEAASTLAKAREEELVMRVSLLSSERDAMEATVQEKDAAVQAKEAKLAESMRDCEALGAQMIRLQALLDEGLSEQEKGLRVKLTETQSKVQAMAAEFGKCQHELEQVAGRERLALATAEQAESRVTRLEAALADASAHASELGEQLMDARSDVERTSMELETLQSRFLLATEELRKVESSALERDSANALSMGEMRLLLDRAQTECKAANEARESAEGQVKLLQSKFKASEDALRDASARFNNALLAKQAALDQAMLNGLEERRKDRAEADSRLRAIEQEFAAKDHQLSVLGGASAESQARFEAIVKEVQRRAAADVAAMESKVMELHHELISARSQGSALQSEVEAAQRDALTQRDYCDALALEMEALKTRLREAETAFEGNARTWQEKVAHSNQLAAEAHADRELVEVELYKSRSDVADLRREVVALNEVMELISASAKDAKDEEMHVRERLRLLSVEIAHHRALREEAQAELARFSAAVLGTSGAAKVQTILDKHASRAARSSESVKRQMFRAWRGLVAG